jgi:hypothetical protein
MIVSDSNGVTIDVGDVISYVNKKKETTCATVMKISRTFHEYSDRPVRTRMSVYTTSRYTTSLTNFGIVTVVKKFNSKDN